MRIEPDGTRISDMWLPKPTAEAVGSKDRFGVWCPECKVQKPSDPHDLHDIVLMRMDWRRAERDHIDTPIPQSPMCLQCFQRIQEEYAPKAPTFDAKGNRVKENTPNS